MPTPTLTDSILAAALQGLELQHQRVSAQIAAVRAQLGAPTPSSNSVAPVPAAPKHQISAAGRKAIAEAQRKRWAAKRQAKTTPEPAPKRRLTAAGRKAIAEATKKRWAAVRAAKAAAEKAAKATRKGGKKTASKAVNRTAKAASSKSVKTAPSLNRKPSRSRQ